MTEEHEPQQRLGRLMLYGMWMLILLMLALAFNYGLDRRDNPNRHLRSTVAADGTREVVLQRNPAGHYVATGFINDHAVTFLVDTGASDVSIPAHLARELGLEQGPAQTYQTAAGPATSYLTTVGKLRLGGITLHGVRASINPNVHDNEVLLGMSFLRHVDFSQRGDKLVLRQ